MHIKPHAYCMPGIADTTQATVCALQNPQMLSKFLQVSIFLVKYPLCENCFRHFCPEYTPNRERGWEKKPPSLVPHPPAAGSGGKNINYI